MDINQRKSWHPYIQFYNISRDNRIQGRRRNPRLSFKQLNLPVNFETYTAASVNQKRNFNERNRFI